MFAATMTHAMVEKAIKEGAVAVLVFGSMEQHGHMAVGCDLLIANHIAQEVTAGLEQNSVPAVLYSSMPYGMAQHHTAYCGTCSLPWGMYVGVVEQMLREMYRQGFRMVVVINGHGGNHAPIAQAIDAAKAFCKGLVVHHMTVPFLLGKADFSKKFPGQATRESNAIADELASAVGEAELAHADACEASLLFVIHASLESDTREEMNGMPRVPDMTSVSGIRDPQEWKERMATGAGGKGDPRFNNVVIGKRLLDTVVRQTVIDVIAMVCDE